MIFGPVLSPFTLKMNEPLPYMPNEKLSSMTEHAGAKPAVICSVASASTSIWTVKSPATVTFPLPYQRVLPLKM